MVIPSVKSPADLPIVIHALLKPRWEWQPKLGRIATATREILTGEKLPVGTEISYLVERLQKVAGDGLSAAEKKLSRWLQFKLRPHTDVDATLREIRTWPCVAEAHIVPPPSLPDSMCIPMT